MQKYATNAWHLDAEQTTNTGSLFWSKTASVMYAGSYNDGSLWFETS